MSYSMIAVNAIAAMLMILVIWWFFGGKITPVNVAVDVPVTIVVKDGVYQPALLQIPAHKQVILHFLRHDDGACAASVIFPQLNLSYELIKDKITAVILPPQQPGELDFTCRMGMYRGKLIVA